ncbi:hypothetical protein AB0I85_19515 [Micromonospora echinofusca]|uniref:hypothetical protein n=1 Tax=Micromonospora echinofusca TaxID=47858 RepID=UPI0018EC9FD7
MPTTLRSSRTPDGATLALDHPEAFSALILTGTRPVASGPVDDDLPDHDAAMMGRRFAPPMPDWSDRAAVAEFAAAGAGILGDDPAAARVKAERTFDPTPGTEPAAMLALSTPSPGPETGHPAGSPGRTVGVRPAACGSVGRADPLAETHSRA